MDVQSALEQIAAVREGVARANTFRGYRAATTAVTGIIAILTSAISQVLLDHGIYDDNVFLILWIGAAVLCTTIVGWEMVWRVGQSGSALQRDLSLSAVERFLPPIAAGGLLTLVFFRFNPNDVWMLPGLWMILFGLAVHASRRLMPRYSGAVAAYYLLCGLLVLSMREQVEFSPWPMGVVFGFGQFLAAVLLKWTERAEQAEQMESSDEI